MASFEDFGLRDPLLRALEDADFEQPTALQEALVPVLRREGNVVARAGSGSGKTLAYALGVLDRIEPRAEPAEGEEAPAAGTRVLVLTPTPEAAERAALALVPFVHALELTVSIPGGAWGTPLADADVLVATPAEVMQGVRGSSLKLESLEAVVVDGASDIEATGGWEAVETLFDHVPRDAQRVVLTTTFTETVNDLVDRRVKRALRYPAQSKVEEAPRASTGVVGYVVVSEREKVDVLGRLLGGGDGAPPVVLCRSDERAATLAESLALRGFLVGEPGDEDADVAIGASSTEADEGEGTDEDATTISFDVPGDERVLLARHGGGATGYVLVEPRELAHLRDIAERAGLDARAAGVTGEDAGAATLLRAFRTEIRRAVREEDLGAQMLVLEPLFEEFTAAEVAAACAALLRKRAPAAQSAPAAPALGSAHSAPLQRPARDASAGAAAAPGRAEAGPAPAAYARLYVGVGERDGVRAGDLVGAIAGETNIPGSSVGRIDIRDTFSIVEVPADLAERVIRAVNGTTIKGRGARVDYDRGADRAAKRATGPRREGGDRPPPRGGTSRGPSGGGARPGGARPGGSGSRPPTRRPPSRG
jgi:ATP-dependent RNA helicase DeaD